MKILQEVITPDEKLAERVATVWDNEGQDSASRYFKDECDKLKITYGSASAIGHIASCMIHGQRWKK